MLNDRIKIRLDVGCHAAGDILRCRYQGIYHALMEIPNTAQLVSGVTLLNNEQVNPVSVALTTALGGGWVIGPCVMTAFR